MLFKTANCLEGTDAEELKTLYEDIIVPNTDPDEVIQDDRVKKVTTVVEHLCDQAAGKGRTATLWINYFMLVSIIRLFICAERTGNWWLHVHSVKQMLPYFHAAGHLAYAKSAHLYIQQMMELHNVMPEKEYKQFTEDGYFTIRRSHRFWSGIFSDQTIEQFLMRLLKTSGGMTRGRGITDSTLARWVHSLPQCVPICDALESFTSVHSGTSDQHRDLRPASQSRDMSDLCIFVQWLEAHPPFVTHEPDILLKKEPTMLSCMDAFAHPASNHEDIATAGEQFLLKLYGAELFATLDKYRHVAYKRSVARTSPSNSFTLVSLPPTTAAARQHSYRVYLQVQQWLGRYLPPTEWGWKTDEHNLIVIGTDQPAAPQTLLKLVSCGCGTGCGNACGCRKAGMVCSDLCTQCMGQTCRNTAHHSMADDDN